MEIKGLLPMGKNFPAIKTLKQVPHLKEKTLQLIENSFGYTTPHAFAVDFAPLIDESNLQNCFILESEEEKVIAHIGVREVSLNINEHEHRVAMLGGIAVNENERGKGYYQQMMSYILADKRDEVAFFLLWSDQEELYKKFGFHLCGQQYELTQKGEGSGFEKTKYHLLAQKEKEDIHSLYLNSFCTNYLSVSRDTKNWEILNHLSSADLYIRRKGKKISDYFFMNKGQDLTGIIYEYASSAALKELLQEIRSYGKVWSAIPVEEEMSSQFQFFLSPADSKLFAAFIDDFTLGKFNLRAINLIKNEAFFDFNGETLALSIEEFLRGTLGPGAFEELGVLKPLFMSGLDSI